MVDKYTQSGNISFTAWKKVKEEIGENIKNRIGRCKCDPLNITVEAEQGFHYSVRVTCVCGKSKDFGDIDGVILNEGR